MKKKSGKPAPSWDDLGFTPEQVIKWHEQGQKFDEIAKRAKRKYSGMALCARVREHCKREGLPFPKMPKVKDDGIDRGKIKALYRAGWMISDIADDCGCTFEEVERVLKSV